MCSPSWWLVAVATGACWGVCFAYVVQSASLRAPVCAHGPGVGAHCLPVPVGAGAQSVSSDVAVGLAGVLGNHANASLHCYMWRTVCDVSEGALDGSLPVHGLVALYANVGPPGYARVMIMISFLSRVQGMHSLYSAQGEPRRTRTLLCTVPM